MCGTDDACIFVIYSAATEVSAVQSTHSHANIVLCSFHVLRTFFRKFRNPDHMLPCGHILYAYSKDLIREDLFQYSSRWTRKYIMNLVLRAMDNVSISTGSDDLLEKFTNNYHSIHALS